MKTRRSFLRKSAAAVGAFTLIPFASKASANRIAESLAELNTFDPAAAALEEDLWASMAQAFTVSPNILNLNNGGVSPQPKVVQDADRLDALGAIGIARCFITGVHLGLPLYHSQEPFPLTRLADDRLYSLDHFYVKLLRLVEGMQTAGGRAEAQRRTEFMERYLAELRREIGE